MGDVIHVRFRPTSSFGEEEKQRCTECGREAPIVTIEHDTEIKITDMRFELRFTCSCGAAMVLRR